MMIERFRAGSYDDSPAGPSTYTPGPDWDQRKTRIATYQYMRIGAWLVSWVLYQAREREGGHWGLPNASRHEVEGEERRGKRIIDFTEFTEQGDLVRLRETWSMVNPENCTVNLIDGVHEGGGTVPGGGM